MNKLHIGDTVINLGLRAVIIGFHPVTKDLILQDADGMKWIADPAKCLKAETAWTHKAGLVVYA